MSSGRLNVSPKHYYGGKVYTVEELKEAFPMERILISNVEGNGYKAAIHCRTGNWTVFEDGDILVEEPQ